MAAKWPEFREMFCDNDGMSKPAKPTARQRFNASGKTVPPRNGLVALVRARAGGAHGKSEKAQRRAAKIILRRGEQE